MISASQFSTHKKQLWPILTICIFGWLCYSNTFNSPFFFDDYSCITDNPHIRISRISWDSLKEVLNSPSQNRPLANLTFALNYFFGEYQVKGYHVVNFVIHILTGIFLFLFFQVTLSLSPNKNYPFTQEQYTLSIPLIASLIWLVNPLNTQAVTYIVQRMTCMASMFFIMSLYLYVKLRLMQTSQNSGKCKIFFCFCGCAFSIFSAMASKEIAVTLPIIIFIYEWFFFQDMAPGWLIKRIPWIMGLLIVIFMIGIIFLKGNPIDRITSSYDALKSIQHFSIFQRLMSEFRVVVNYLNLFIWPHPERLHLDYIYPVSESFIYPTTTLISFIAIFSLFLLAVCTARVYRIMAFCIIWFFANLVLESSVIGLALVYEHRAYLPSMMLSLLIVVAVYHLIQKKWLRLSIFTIVICTFSFWTFQRNAVWHDRLVFWKDNMVKAPANPRPVFAVGKIMFDNNRISEALECFTAATTLKPDYQEVYISLGNVYSQIGQMKKAAQNYKTALLINPQDIMALNQLSNIFIMTDDCENAIRYLKKAFRLDPNNPTTLNNMGNSFYCLNDLDQASRYYQSALEKKANFFDAHFNLGMVFSKQRKYNQAIHHFTEAIRLMPDHAEAHKNIADLYFEINDIEKAILHYRKAMLLIPDNARINFNLGVAYYRLNDLKNAMHFFKKTLEIDPEFRKAKHALEQLHQSTNEPVLNEYVQ